MGRSPSGPCRHFHSSRTWSPTSRATTRSTGRSLRSPMPRTTARRGASARPTSTASTSSASASSATCARTCATSTAHGLLDRFYGPRFFVRVASLEMHPKDVLDRTEQTRDEGGLAYCNVTKCCTEVCPEHIHITDNAIIPRKERVADKHWDPVRWMGRRMFGNRDNDTQPPTPSPAG